MVEVCGPSRGSFMSTEGLRVSLKSGRMLGLAGVRAGPVPVGLRECSMWVCGQTGLRTFDRHFCRLVTSGADSR